MSGGEFLIWCIGGAMLGYAVGATLADPEYVLGGLWAGIVRAVMLPCQMARRDR